jgi:hypothetical protein
MKKRYASPLSVFSCKCITKVNMFISFLFF